MTKPFAPEPGVPIEERQVPLPLVVDVDGTLIRTDLLHEATMQFVAHHPLQAWRLIPWVLSGKAGLKTELANRVAPEADTLPLCSEVVALIAQVQKDGRPVYLASASDRRYVEAIAARIGGIAGVFATDKGANLAGAAKAKVLEDAFGIGQFDYVGNCGVDFAIWQSSRTPLVVARGKRFEARVGRDFPGAQIVARPRTEPRAYIRALRTHQWAKNVLVFLPLIAGHNFTPEVILATMLACVCFCLAASSAYIVNDLLDLPADRVHPRKSKRPFAAGDVPISHGIMLSAALMASAVGLALLLPPVVLGILLLYVAATLGYSLILKRRMLIDVIVLGGLYTIRVLGGMAVVGGPESQWLLMFSLFFFLSLAIVKRCSELVAQRQAGRSATVGRGYRVEDLSILLPLGAASGFGAVFVVALYMSSPEVMRLYTHPDRLWLVCPLLIYWISRVLMISNRGDLHDDPVIYALTDKVSWATGICVALVIALSI